ncbi:DUF3515 family protein [Rhizohabitans arisaemae]|uniref:DUF3515 family protein n=1 Tax=Rhizohabitans arisaemae TaxID=2720610 RepID=UPI0024B25EC7|nr:DUF3515 family protein [Rhizohabitans arisaemae]
MTTLRTAGRRRFPITPFAAAVLLLAGCGGPVQVAPPVPEGAAAAACAALHDRLPRTLLGQARVETSPPSPYVTVWGSPTIALRCGVPRPAAMRPTDHVSEIDGVSWFSDRPTLYTAIGRVAYVELTVSTTYPAGEILVDLAGPIKAAVPPPA